MKVDLKSASKNAKILFFEKKSAKKSKKIAKKSKKSEKNSTFLEKNENFSKNNPNNLREVLLVGNPNSGKTTLFNALTSSNEHVGNWHGVTVDTVGKSFSCEGEDYFLIDTPGIYSLCPLSYEEKVAVSKIEECCFKSLGVCQNYGADKLSDEQDEFKKTESTQKFAEQVGSGKNEQKFEEKSQKMGVGCKIINICDQNNLQRNLYLTLCLLERGCDVILAINEIDKKPIYKVEFKNLSQRLGIPVVQINAEKKIGTDTLKKCLKSERSSPKLPYLKEIADVFNAKSTQNLSSNAKSLQNLSFIAESTQNSIIKEENSQNFISKAQNPIFNSDKLKKYPKKFLAAKVYEKDKNFFEAAGLTEAEQKQIFDSAPPDSMQQIAALRYAYIDEILKASAVKTQEVYGSSKLDKIFLNKWLAFPVFICILAVIFQLTFFSLGAALSDALGQALGCITTPILNLVRQNLGEGFVYSLLSDAIFGGVGTVLSFLPQVVLLFFFLSVLEDSGYMSRIAFIFEDILGRIGLSGKSIYTLLMGFGCSTTAIMTSRNMEDKNAKIKTAILCPYMSCSAKIPIYTVVGGAFFGAKNIFVIMGLYALGVIVAITISKILDATVLKSKAQSFILEFPPYRKTSLKRVGKILWKNVKEFLLRVGSVMISMNIIIWLLSSFSFSFKFVGSGQGVSILESFGRILAPIFSPLGFGNWAVVASLLAGLVAKEVVISSFAMFNGIDQNAIKLLSASLLLPTSVVFFSSRASVAAFLVFCLLYTPCIASIAMLLQEVGKKWTIISIIIQFASAYILAFLTYQILFAMEIFGSLSIFAIILSIFAIFFAIFYIFRKIKKKKLCPHCDQCNKECHRKKQ